MIVGNSLLFRFNPPPLNSELLSNEIDNLREKLDKEKAEHQMLISKENELNNDLLKVRLCSDMKPLI